MAALYNFHSCYALCKWATVRHSLLVLEVLNLNSGAVHTRSRSRRRGRVDSSFLLSFYSFIWGFLSKIDTIVHQIPYHVQRGFTLYSKHASSIVWQQKTSHYCSVFDAASEDSNETAQTRTYVAITLQDARPLKSQPLYLARHVTCGLMV